MSVQPTTNVQKSSRKQMPLPLYLYDKNNNHHYGFDLRSNEESIYNRMHMANNTNNPLNVSTGLLRFDPFTNTEMFPNATTMQQHHHDEKMRKALSVDETSKYYHHDRQ
ncbi:unnamed protein product, partial [Rotaria magnacalcarata]